MGQTGTLNWVHGHHLGTPILTTNAAGQAITPTGTAILGFPGQFANALLLSGAQHYYNRYRDYNFATGRYIQADPIGLAGDDNPYAYAAGNPLRYTDPSGEFVPILIGIAVGAGSDLAFQASMNFIQGREVLNWRCYDWGQVAISGGLGAVGGGLGACANSASKGVKLGRGLGGNPFKGKTPQEIAKMFQKKGFEPRGANPLEGRGSFVNPKTGRGYHIDANHLPPKGPHVGVHRPRNLRDAMPSRDYPL